MFGCCPWDGKSIRWWFGDTCLADLVRGAQVTVSDSRGPIGCCANPCSTRTKNMVRLYLLLVLPSSNWSRHSAHQRKPSTKGAYFKSREGSRQSPHLWVWCRHYEGHDSIYRR
ncbi:hypothetical protein BAUCODRAFT_29729 [Baudoinia panamericana UAMH 10762]|uniref:Uncharacterized protein n=1 Tax=Baudoinia panamericana (strain UAMH 10762) TaxID=717646 RepID=M2NP10_BAUPA|nr:uncharacterized protein BAUCODRAFT_29729 [Baudoinia panamericana UAMH 10762]EMD01285.1 hypothetical protein BAUCODRAFT_29729 [Baudoinia panamericana UAMH 10762]